MDKPRIFLGSSGKQAKLLEALTRGLEDIAHAERHCGRDSADGANRRRGADQKPALSLVYAPRIVHCPTLRDCPMPQSLEL